VNAAFPATGPAVDEIPPPTGTRTGAGTVGYLLSPRSNWATLAVNRLLKSGARVARTSEAVETAGRTWDAGTFVVRGADGQSRTTFKLLFNPLFASTQPPGKVGTSPAGR